MRKLIIIIIMGLLPSIFSSCNTKEQINSYADFWNWFEKSEKRFFKIVEKRNSSEINVKFFDPLSDKLDELKDGYYFLAGLDNDSTAELIISAEGDIKNFIFVEELVAAAPNLLNWKFTALKPALNIEDINIEMNGCKFSANNIYFYSNDNSNFPDEVDITIVYTDFEEENKKTILSGTYIFLDNYLGELYAATTIDNLNIIGTNEVEKELIPIERLKSYLIWREKEFVEKYEGERYNTKNDLYSTLDATTKDGSPVIAVVNSTMLEWDRKASHPYILEITIQYDGENNNGLPNSETFNLLTEIEDEIMTELEDFAGFLNVCRRTANNKREIYFACKDFRKPSKVLYQISEKYQDKLEISYDIYKDKYWQALEWFRPQQ